MPITTRERRLLLASRTITFHLTTDRDNFDAPATTVVKGWNDAHEVTVEVKCDRTTVDNYGGHGENLTGYVHIIGGGKYNEFARTWLTPLRDGSMLRARWTRNNASPVLTEHNMVCDEFALSTYDSEGRNEKAYRIDKYVGPDNTARMTTIKG